mmetsp:Transcript_51823/g.116724  ORF Transcript_51823/g.116724 Transcript_51823/m.116724 type:complete len:216 (-) Transcript_51823:978-1625(-)
MVLEPLAVGIEDGAVDPDDQDAGRLNRGGVLVDADPGPAILLSKSCKLLVRPKNVHLRVDELPKGKDEGYCHSYEDSLESSEDECAGEGNNPGDPVFPLPDLVVVGPQLPSVTKLEQANCCVGNDDIQDALGDVAQDRPEDLHNAHDDDGHKDIGPEWGLHPHVIRKGTPAETNLRGHSTGQATEDVCQAERQQFIQGRNLVAALHATLLGTCEG